MKCAMMTVFAILLGLFPVVLSLRPETATRP